MNLDLKERDLCDWLSLRAAAHPERVVLIDGERRLSWAELDDRVARFAEALLSQGLRRGDSLVTLLPNSIEFVVSFLAAIRLGVTAIPMNPQFREAEIEQYLDDARPRVIIAAEPLAKMVQQVLTNRSFIDRVLIGVPQGEGPWYQFDDLIETHRPRVAREAVSPDTDALCLYSSGSTGGSKRVLRTQGHLAAEAAALEATVGVSQADRILCVVPLSHAHGLGNGLLATLYSGATLVLQPSFERRAVLDCLEQERISMFPAVPFMFRVLGNTPMKRKLDLTALRLCISAGAPLTREAYAAFKERFGIDVRQLYGSTETGAASINMSDDADSSWESVGAPLAGVEIQIFGEGDRQAAAGEEGRVGIRSPGMFRGYIGRDDLTAECVRGGFFFPGDLGHCDDSGRLTITGRESIFINLGGNKVNPADVEKVLVQHPAIDEAVVVGVRTPTGEEQVKAVVVSKESLDPADIIEFCRGRIADYKVPARVEFRDEIPRSPLGKILRKYLI